MGPSFSKGWYILLAPPPAGSHTIHFKGTAGDPTAPDGGIVYFSLDVTYNLTVQ